MEKIKGGLSAGRVQSVSVRLIVERKDIQNFNAVASYSIVAEFTNGGKVIQGKSSKKISILKKRSGGFL
jgi:DNA topoisomerase-1